MANKTSFLFYIFQRTKISIHNEEIKETQPNHKITSAIHSGKSSSSALSLIRKLSVDLMVKT